MNYLRLAVALLFAVCAQCSHADSIQTFHITEATMVMGPNDGSGDNIYFDFTGPGVHITGIGGMFCFDWCSVSGPVYDLCCTYTSQIFLTGFGTAVIGGVSYDPNTLAFDSLFSEGGGLNALTRGSVGEGDTFFEFRMTAPCCSSWALNFTYVPDGNPPYYFFTDGEFHASATVVPEPATSGLIITGVVGIAGVVKRKAKFCH